jgi:hypothetical protein
LAVVHENEKENEEEFKNENGLRTIMISFQRNKIIASPRRPKGCTCRLLNFFDCYGFVVHVAGVPTHDFGGSIDIVASRSACGDPIFVAGGPVVSVLDPGLSDHRLLRWSVADDIPPCPPPRQKTCHAWRRLSVDDFICEVQASALCRPECWQRFDLDEMAELYDCEVTAAANRLVPARIVVCR